MVEQGASVQAFAALVYVALGDLTPSGPHPGPTRATTWAEKEISGGKLDWNLKPAEKPPDEPPSCMLAEAKQCFV